MTTLYDDLRRWTPGTPVTWASGTEEVHGTLVGFLRDEDGGNILAVVRKLGLAHTNEVYAYEPSKVTLWEVRSPV